jgi:DNA polymerase IV (DinB-like DNA polymerase)
MHLRDGLLNRVIGHVDLDYFYAQVEEVENPTIKGRPVVVCVFSGRTEDSGVVSAANYRAREFGVRSGTPIVVAKRRLEGKDPVMVRMEIAKYEAVSERVMDLVRANVDVLEKVGIDEAFFDLTSSSGGDFRKARVTAGRIKETILAEEHLACSIGLGRSKAVAKLGSDSAKPGGLIVVPSEETEVFMKDTEVIKLYGVGPKTAETLDRMQIRTIGELARSDVTRLEDTLGRKLAVYLHAASNGIDGDPVLPEQEPTQYSRIITLKDDTTDAEEVMSQLSGACDSLRGKLATAKKSFRTITAIAILTDLSTKTRSRTFQTPVSDISSVKKTTLELFEQLSETADKGFRRVGIRVSDLVGNQDQQSLSGYLRAK